MDRNPLEAPAASAASRREAMRRLAALFAGFGMAACGGGSGGDAPGPAPAPPPPVPSPPAPPPPAPAPPPAGPLQVAMLNDTLSSPWALAFLPDGRMLITQRGGGMVILSADGASKTPVSGVPAAHVAGQGGLLDVALDPDFATDPWIYFSYAEGDASAAGTAVGRARLVGNTLQGFERIFQQLPKVSGGAHYGSRLVFRADKTLFVTLGERDKKTPAQDLAGHLGKVVRIRRDGTVPPDNPASLKGGGLDQLWSYGHRNPQGAALHPATGELWLTEHGPQGGDELNRVPAGGNHGWPLVSYGCDYGVSTPNCEIGGGTHAPSYVEPVSRWPAPGTPTPSPSIAPCGLMFYTGDKFPEWQGHAFVGALAGTALWRIALSGNAETGRERLLASLGQRIRDVRQGPDGWIYLLTDSGRLIRVYR
ncbi:MAG: PQQ-dependent sugar dehydrogenase [Pseudomonadota bacterium]